MSSFPEKPVIALVGPPNSGKTTLFNYLSGKNFKTVNYPGSTIEYHTSDIHPRFNFNATILDSPGIISLIPNSLDEEVTIKSIFEHPKFGKPHLVIVTADASQISRHLLLTQQLMECGFNTVLAITMLDILQKKNRKLDIKKLSLILGIPVVGIDGRNGDGVEQLIEIAKKKINTKKEIRLTPPDIKWKDTNSLLEAYRKIEEIEKQIIIRPTLIDKKNLEQANKQLKVIQPENIADDDDNMPDPITLKLDRYFLHPIWGGILFFLIMAFTFTAIFWLAIPVMDLVDGLFASAAKFVITAFGHSIITDLISEGIISGVGAVMVFVPQIIILFLILGFMEDTGYLARGAMIADKPLNKIGLNGRSFVPMLSGFACAVPAIMAARTIPNRRERLLTIFIIPLMSCSARLPVYVLLLAFLTPHDKIWLAGLGLAAIYVFSIVSSTLAAALINRFNKSLIKDQDNSSFILELPAYRMPKLKVILRNTYISTTAYLRKAGPIILGLSIVIWFLTSFPNYNPDIKTDTQQVKNQEELVISYRLENSYAAYLGKFIQPLMEPLGMDWRVGVSLISAFAAREIFVSSLALIFKVTADTEDALQESILSAMKKAKIDGDKPLFTPSKVIGLIVFFVFALQCLSTVAIARQETGSWRIPLLQLAVYTPFAYLVALLTINLLQLFGIS